MRIDDRDEVEVAELSDYCSTARDTETCHTELGYEADSEFTSDDMLNGMFTFNIYLPFPTYVFRITSIDRSIAKNFKLRQILPKYQDVARQCKPPPPPPKGCEAQVRRKRMEDVTLTSLGEGGTKNLKIGFRVRATLDNSGCCVMYNKL